MGMYYVVEFTEEGGGGISCVRQEWLTPDKQQCMWPPKTTISKFNKCIDGSIVPDDTWDLNSIKRIFYKSDNLAKAREKAKQAESVSDVNSDYETSEVRKRKKTHKIYDSDNSDGNSNDDTVMIYPKPPATQIGPKAKTRFIPNEESDTGLQKKVAASRSSSISRSTPGTSASSTDEQYSISSDPLFATINPESSLPNLSMLDLTLTPFLEESAARNSHALDVIAKHLARIESDIKELQISQSEILQRLRSSGIVTEMELSLPEAITLPCDDFEALNKIEAWTEENGKHLVTYLSLVGGNKLAVIIRRILEKLFSNKLAIQFNWTGKNKKTPLKDLKLMKIIRDAVRLNKIAEKATDYEIHEVISNWFRFTKDRNGGREARRVKQ